MSDLISRQAVFDALIEKGQNSKRYKLGEKWELNLPEIIEAINVIPSAEPERKWISITEKLPWTDTNVLVTVRDDSGDTPWEYASVGWLTPDGKYWVVDNEVCYGVIAWMPLPEPWKGE